MGIYANIGAARVSRSSSFYEPGEYRVKIKSVKDVDSTQRPGKMYFVIETICLESDNPKIRVGGEYSQVIDLQNIMAAGNIKQFLAAASGVPPEADDDQMLQETERFWSAHVGRNMSFEQICELVTSNANPLEDVVLHVSATSIKTKAGGDFTKMKWAPLTD
jgi:hypothetical protein